MVTLGIFVLKFSIAHSNKAICYNFTTITCTFLAYANFNLYTAKEYKFYTAIQRICRNDINRQSSAVAPNQSHKREILTDLTQK